MRRLYRVAPLTILLLLFCAPVHSKGSPDKILITGANLSQPIEIDDREALKEFDPWNGRFIDWATGSIAAPADRTPIYQVLFYVKWKGRRTDPGELSLIYDLRYCPGANGERGYIYLPGTGELGYATNAGTIIRADDDGKWHRASSDWDKLMKRLVTRDQRPAVTNTRIAGVSWRSAPYLAAIAVILFISRLFPILRSVETKTGRTSNQPPGLRHSS